MSVGGCEFGSSQLHIVYPQHVLYELFEFRAFVGTIHENVGFCTKWKMMYRHWDLSACSDTGFSYFSKAG